MAHAGQEITGPDGFRLKLVRTAAETGGELLEMEASYGGNGVLPPQHFHPRQDERFTVLEGTIRAVVEGETRIYEAGESFDVPAGTPLTFTAHGWAVVVHSLRPGRNTVTLEVVHPDNSRELFITIILNVVRGGHSDDRDHGDD